MSKVSLAGAPTGTATFDIVAPATNTNRTLTLPDATGPMPVMQLLTAQTAAGTVVDFLNIPAWATRVTVLLNEVSTNGTSPFLLQMGSGSVQTSGYRSSASFVTSAVSTTSSTTAFCVHGGAVNATTLTTATLVLNKIQGNRWALGVSGSISAAAGSMVGGGVVELSGALDRIRLTTVNGTDTFDAGTINLLLEGY